MVLLFLQCRRRSSDVNPSSDKTSVCGASARLPGPFSEWAAKSLPLEQREDWFSDGLFESRTLADGSRQILETRRGVGRESTRGKGRWQRRIDMWCGTVSTG